ncbi:MAG: hypothetical protein M1433_02385 [Candidatus Parvarchaeota archaeon]|jgi:hypothetical protein|nr:hypothetical protein [Candidatus Parvarchaeota archaeon]
MRTEYFKIKDLPSKVGIEWTEYLRKAADASGLYFSVYRPDFDNSLLIMSFNSFFGPMINGYSLAIERLSVQLKENGVYNTLEFHDNPMGNRKKNEKAFSDLCRGLEGLL